MCASSCTTCSNMEMEIWLPNGHSNSGRANYKNTTAISAIMQKQGALENARKEVTPGRGVDSRHMGKSLSRLPLPVGQQGNKTAIDFPSGEGFTNER